MTDMVTVKIPKTFKIQGDVTPKGKDRKTDAEAYAGEGNLGKLSSEDLTAYVLWAIREQTKVRECRRFRDGKRKTMDGPFEITPVREKLDAPERRKKTANDALAELTIEEREAAFRKYFPAK